MTYQPGDYVYPSDLPRPHLCRVRRVETVGKGRRTQILGLEPLEGPWARGTELVRLDDGVLPARPERLWQRRARGIVREDAA